MNEAISYIRNMLGPDYSEKDDAGIFVPHKVDSVARDKAIHEVIAMLEREQRRKDGGN